MQNFDSAGLVITLTAPMGGVTTGAPVVVGNIFCVATATVAAGLPFEGLIEGVVELPKLAMQAQAEGEPAYWTGAAVTNAAGMLKEIGVIIRAELAATTTSLVRLIPAIRQSTAA